MRAGIRVPFEIEPSYNIAPMTYQPVVRLDRDTDERELVPMRWGLVPFWARDANVSYSTINAKAETLTMSETYREAIKRRRCLVPADGFFEWKKLDAKNKQPFAFALKDGSMIAFAGIWERWRDEATSQVLETYSIITTEPNELMAPIHSRMPVILAPRDYERWLAPADPARLPMDLLRPFDSEQLKVWKVGADVGNAKNDRPDLIDVQPESKTPREPVFSLVEEYSRLSRLRRCELAQKLTLPAQRERPVKRRARSCSIDGKRFKLRDGADAPWAGQSVTPEVAATLLRLLDDQPDSGGCQPSSGCEIPGQRRMWSIA